MNAVHAVALEADALVRLGTNSPVWHILIDDDPLAHSVRFAIVERTLVAVVPEIARISQRNDSPRAVAFYNRAIAPDLRGQWADLYLFNAEPILARPRPASFIRQVAITVRRAFGSRGAAR